MQEGVCDLRIGTGCFRRGLFFSVFAYKSGKRTMDGIALEREIIIVFVVRIVMRYHPVPAFHGKGKALGVDIGSVGAF